MERIDQSVERTRRQMCAPVFGGSGSISGRALSQNSEYFLPKPTVEPRTIERRVADGAEHRFVEARRARQIADRDGDMIDHGVPASVASGP